MSLRKPDVVTVALTRADGGLMWMRVVTRSYRPPNEAEIAVGIGRNQRVVDRSWEPTPDYVNSLIAKLAHRFIGPKAVVSWRFVPNDYVPDSITRDEKRYRDAWKDDGVSSRPIHDMPKARELHRAKLRKARGARMDALDALYMQALETNDVVRMAAIVARKQALRDAPADPRIEAAATVEDLKAITLPED